MRRALLSLTAAAAVALAGLVSPSAAHAAEPRTTTNACPVPATSDPWFWDMKASTTFAPSVGCLRYWQVTAGNSDGSYRPAGQVTRAEMATFIARSIQRSGGTLPTPTRDYFTDDRGSAHEKALNALAQAGVMKGSAPGKADPYRVISRVQMAALVVRSHDYRAAQAGKPGLPRGANAFTDDDGYALATEVDKAAAAGIIAGTGARTFSPGGAVRRDHMAAFLTRLLDVHVAGRIAALPPAPPAAPRPVPPVQTLVSEAFSGADGVFASQNAFWGSQDRGLTQNRTWFAEGGTLERRASAGRTESANFRVWTRRTDLAFTTAAMDVRFNGWTGGSDGWHGINLWMNRTLCTPVPGCSAVGDSGGNSGYALDFMNRDGSVTILKKVPGDTRGKWPTGATTYVQGGTYYQLAKTRWSPTAGKTYRFAGRVINSGKSTATLQILVNGQVILQVVDNGSVGGPRLTGGRVGIRGDYASFMIDNVAVTR